MIYREILENENFYGHLRRLNWIKSKIAHGDTVLEVGCETGSFITTPLILSNIDAYGIDIGMASIAEAQRIAKINGIDINRYKHIDVSKLSEQYDVVICSEVLEHIRDKRLYSFCKALCEKVKVGGRLIITVPNKIGSYEIGEKYFREPLELIQEIIKQLFVKKFFLLINQEKNIDNLRKARDKECQNLKMCEGITSSIKMSPDDSPHVQWFSFEDILNLIMPEGFRLIDFTGSSMFSGIIINTFFKPNRVLCGVNNKLGELFPHFASGYYFLFEKIK